MPERITWYIANGIADSRTEEEERQAPDERRERRVGPSQNYLELFTRAVNSNITNEIGEDERREVSSVEVRESFGGGTVAGFTEQIRIARQEWEERGRHPQQVFFMQDSRWGRAMERLGWEQDRWPSIVCGHIKDPLKGGRIRNIQRPGRKMTGVWVPERGLLYAQVEMGKELFSGAEAFGYLYAVDRRDRADEHELEEAARVARAWDMDLVPIPVRESDRDPAAEISGAVNRINGRPRFVVIAHNPVFDLFRKTTLESLEARGLAAIAPDKEFTARGAVASYSVGSAEERTRLGAGLVAQVLMGRDVGEVPMAIAGNVEQALNEEVARNYGADEKAILRLRAYATHYYP
jgi:hypothetical protein